MGIFDIFRRKPYDMDSLEGINAIPVPAKNYTTGNPTKDSIYYLLQRKATEHKKNGKMDLAIACLRKSNSLSDYEQHPLLTPKEYMRVIKYLEYDQRFEEAASEAEKIMKKHPEFSDKRISNLPRIKNTLQNCKKFKNDLVFVSTNNHCPICKKYNSKIYSISGKTKSYPNLPIEITTSGGFCSDCYLSLSIYTDGISTPIK